MCGIVAISGENVDAYGKLRYMLHAEQHRGQSSSGVAVRNSVISVVKGGGLVSRVLTPEKSIQGSEGIGHVRYATSGPGSENGSGDVETCAQPIYHRNASPLKRFVFAFNGQVNNLDELNKQFNTEETTDTFLLERVIADEMAKQKRRPNLEEVFRNVSHRIK